GPRVGRAGRSVVAHATGDEHAVLGEIDVAAVFLAGALGGPAEDLAVERLAAVGVGGEEVGPAGGPDGGGFASHSQLLRSNPMSRDSTTPAAPTHRYPGE